MSSTETASEGLSQEEFEKLREDFVERWVDVDKRSIARAGFHAGYTAASSLKQAPDYGSGERMREMFQSLKGSEGKQAEPSYPLNVEGLKELARYDKFWLAAFILLIALAIGGKHLLDTNFLKHPSHDELDLLK